MADITLPQLGETVTEGTITQWFKSVGDHVAEDEPLFEVSTDKVDTEVPSPVGGILAEIRAEEGDTVEVGAVIAVVGASAPPAITAVASVSPPPTTTEPARVASHPVRPPADSGGNRLLSPVVRRLVKEHGLDADQIRGTGHGGRITRDDVLSHIDATDSKPIMTPTTSVSVSVDAPAPAPSSATPAAGERDTSVPLSKIRKLTGDHMVMSKATSPHAFSVVEVNFANVDATRHAIQVEWKEQHGFSLTYLPFISRAVIDALNEFPHMNSSVSGDELMVHRFVDLAIAIDLDYQGLLAPVIRSAETKRLAAIAVEISDLADRARRRKLVPDEIQGGTITISNNGSAGSVLTMPIINQPQVAIISTDAIVRKPVVVSANGLEAIAVHPVGNLAMSWDHRAFDGAYAAGFLKKVKELLETKDWSTEL